MHPCSLINAFVIRCLDSIIPLVSNPKFQASALLLLLHRPVCIYSVANPKDRCSHEEAHIYCKFDPNYSDRQVWANIVNPDQTAPGGLLDEGLLCLPFHLHRLDMYGKTLGLLQQFFKGLNVLDFNGNLTLLKSY